MIKSTCVIMRGECAYQYVIYYLNSGAPTAREKWSPRISTARSAEGAFKAFCADHVSIDVVILVAFFVRYGDGISGEQHIGTVGQQLNDIHEYIM